MTGDEAGLEIGQEPETEIVKDTETKRNTRNTKVTNTQKMETGNSHSLIQNSKTEWFVVHSRFTHDHRPHFADENQHL